MSISYPQKFTGTATWLYPGKNTFGQFLVTKAVLHSHDELVIDCECGSPSEPYLYTMSLHRTVGNRFEGPFEAGHTVATQSTGTMSGRLYTADSGLILRGNWVEDGTSEIIIELSAVAHFPDESPVA